MSGEICTDNRFEIIASYKKVLVESTNIETSPDEMAVIDNVLFRFWQMGWLNPHKTNADRIRAMTDEGLARFFDFEAFLCPWCDVSCGGVEELPCRQCILKWLKREAET